jgi:hypothetical protein
MHHAEVFGKHRRVLLDHDPVAHDEFGVLRVGAASRESEAVSSSQATLTSLGAIRRRAEARGGGSGRASRLGRCSEDQPPF